MLSSKVLLYVTSDKPGAETQIAQDVVDIFIRHLDSIGISKKISLILYTRGGDTAAAWNIVNLLRIFCDDFQVIIPHKAHSAGTLISIGANSIIMTKQATLGPIDPSVNTPLNPIAQNGPMQMSVPVSVEAIKGYLAFAKEELKIEDDNALASIMVKLSDKVHPLVLGQVYRARAQIKMLAEKLLANQLKDSSKIKEIIAFLCSDSGSHDYTINRREAKDILGLNIIKPTDEMYKLINAVYTDFSNELEFGSQLDLLSLAKASNGAYSIKRGLIESLKGGSDFFVTEGRLRVTNFGVAGQQQVNEERVFEGWKHE